MSVRNQKRRYERSIADPGPFKGRVGLVYVRVSGKSQELTGHGRESQDARCQDDLRSVGVPYEKSFIDTFTGGGDFMLRPAMRAMLSYIDAHPHKMFVVVFDDLKRFARDTEFHIKLRKAFQARGVLLRCLNYNFEDSPEGRFAETVFAAQNQLEREQNRRQVIQKMKARLDAGYWPFPRRRGYDFVPRPGHGRVAVPNTEGLQILKPALEGFANGNLFRKIDVCNYLVERGFWGKQDPVKYIDKMTALFKDPFYCGDIVYEHWGVKRRPGHHEALISTDTHEKILRRLNRDGAVKHERKDITEEFCMRGLLDCVECGKHITAANTVKKRTGQKFPYYYCQNRKCGLYGKMLRKKDVEDKFRVLLERNKLKPESSVLTVSVFDVVWEQEMTGLKWQDRITEERKEDLKRNVKRLVELSRKTTSDAVQRAYEMEIEEAAREVEKMEEATSGGKDLSIPYRTALDKATKTLENPISIWDSVDVHEQHRLFFFLFEAKLQYDKEDGYRTGDSLSTTRLFEELAAAKTLDVVFV
ncbi:hypothetical protein A2880_02740 [Candidatus Peribacteria bacterium RIFCSPHIGHO2_01_FULL_49_38]|nr:MAG: hypothetical protein A2880_02740 [Candidatus Peribacteria bacterium RIFCSPHIGHO2_01_FULL_49_38]